MKAILSLWLSACFSVVIMSPSLVYANTMLGAFIKHDGWSTDEIDRFNDMSHKPIAVQNLYANFNIHWNYLSIQTSNIVSRGATPMISLMPSGSRHKDMLAAIIAGEEDVFLNSWINSFKAWRESYPENQQPVILLRFGHEFNGNWYPWGNRPEDYKAAWRHVYAMFEDAGANEHIEWVWAANATDVDDYRDIRVYYPGDEFVDWTGLDGYNWGTNYSWSSWRNFDQIFSYAYNRLIQNYPEKPIIIAELGSAEPGDLPDHSWGQFGNNADADQDKDIWVENMLTRIEDSYPAIRAITWFNINKELSWALNKTSKTGQPNTGLNGYNLGLQSEHFKGDFARFGYFCPKQQAMQSQIITKSPIASFYEKLLNMMFGKAYADQLELPEQVKNDKAKKLNKEQLKAKIGELQKTLALSKKPEVVGEELRDKEANGRKNMPEKYLRKMSEARLQLGQPLGYIPETPFQGFYFDIDRWGN